MSNLCVILLSVAQICSSVALIVHLVDHRKRRIEEYNPYGYSSSRDLI